MSVFHRNGWSKRFVLGALAITAIGAATPRLAPAQTRTLASLADVPTFVPVPYHPQMLTAHYGSAIADTHPYYGGIYLGGGARYWH